MQIRSALSAYCTQRRASASPKPFPWGSAFKRAHGICHFHLKGALGTMCRHQRSAHYLLSMFKEFGMIPFFLVKHKRLLSECIKDFQKEHFFLSLCKKDSISCFTKEERILVKVQKRVWTLTSGLNSKLLNYHHTKTWNLSYDPWYLDHYNLPCLQNSDFFIKISV